MRKGWVFKKSLLAVLCLGLWLNEGLAGEDRPQVGTDQQEIYRADVNGDRTRDTIILHKVVSNVFEADRDYVDYEVSIEILDGKTGEKLFESQKFHTSAIGVFAVEGELKIHLNHGGLAQMEYVETTTYTESDVPQKPSVVRYLFEWDGKQIQMKVQQAT